MAAFLSSSLHTPPLPSGAPPHTGNSWIVATLVSAMLVATLGYPLIRLYDFHADNTLADASFSEGNLLTQLMFGSAFLAAGLLAWRHGSWSLPVLRRMNPFMLALVLWAACSILWSTYPVVTLKRVLQLIGIILIGICLTLPQLRDDHMPRAVSRMITILLTVSFAVVVTMPQIGVDALREGGWRGILWHKNGLGTTACFGSLLLLHRIFIRDISVRAGSILLAFTLMMLLMSRSSTALLSALVGLATLTFLHYRTRISSPLLAVSTLGALVLLVAALLLFFTLTGRLPSWDELSSPLLSLLGKSSDLTGRTELWRLIMLEINHHPLHGIGFGAFWLNIGSPSQYIIDAVHWIPLQAHNGYLDVLNELGAIGLALLIGMLAWHLWLLVRLIRVAPDRAPLHWAIFVIIVINSFSESQILRGMLFANCLFFYSSLIVTGILAQPSQTSSPDPT